MPMAAVEARRHHAICEAAGFAQPERNQLRQMQRACPRRTIDFAARTGFGDVSDRIGTGIAIGGRIRGAADADRIHHQKDGTHISAS
jgi:hypothetical protein